MCFNLDARWIQRGSLQQAIPFEWLVDDRPEKGLVIG